MTENLEQLREIAQNATPGPWEVHDRGIGYEVHDANGYELNGGMRETFTEADATHIATFDPPTVMGLIDRVEAAEESHRLANVMLRTVLEELGSGPETDPIIKVRQLVARAEAAEAAMQRVREVATGEPTAYGWGGAMDTIIRALDGGEQE